MSSPLVSIVSVAGAMQVVAWPLGLNRYATGITLAQWAAFLPSYWAGTEMFYDLTGSLTYMATMLASRSLSPAREGRQLLATLLVLAWALRLGLFLFTRVMRVGKDSRFDKVKGDPLQFLQFWTVQGLWVFLCSLPVLVLNTKKAGEERCPWPGLTDAAGILLYLLGLAVEMVADLQKHAFLNDSQTRGQWIDVGLWSYSRHPNYAGEITLWAGITLLASGGFTRAWDWLGLLCPVFVTLLLTQVSVPMTEAGPNKKWGADKAYKAYMQRTPAVFPIPFLP